MKNQKKILLFRYLGHIEIGKVTKFGGIGDHFKGQIGLTLLYNWVAVIKTLKNKENIDT